MKTILLLFLMMWFIPDVWGQQVEYVAHDYVIPS